MKRILWCLLWAPFFCAAQLYEIKPLNDQTKTSLRGLSVVSNNVIWVSGSNGSVGKSVDGGKNWVWFHPAGYEKLDFRDIEAFNENEAVIVNAGSPAYILKTKDGGKTWSQCYRNDDAAIFLDGFSFWNRDRGIVFGDPIANRMQLLTTQDGGVTWKDISANLKQSLADGEAAFAASGTTIKTLSNGKVWIATGGTISNIYFSADYGNTWKTYKCPIWQGEPSTGPFSMDFYDANTGVVVGGNYVKDKISNRNALTTTDGGKTWNLPAQSVFGYRSGVTFISKKMLVATGTSGTDISKDGGANWTHISDKSYNAVQKAKNGNLIILAGENGTISNLQTK
ncbi:WD40/YVTN/BNR-like repeat-containing protein [Pedobacter sandarakinus]|uniref:WD40/YVTN/BNR-like repeat-containing protein n=1 Tax=Pedobacter sandarakinus TaxID=353156 RepID=UPI002246C9E4|nr:YCF48-related protein [Pedobacter sandarakinus]MCX2575276.1 YCF48-related protein [Pedobacter sandarakinus]